MSLWIFILIYALCGEEFFSITRVEAAYSFCPTGFTFVATTYRCYQLNTNPLNWFDAEKYCNSIGGHLTYIESREEQFGVYQTLIASTNTTIAEGAVWIGGNDISLEGEWRWVDESDDGVLFSSTGGYSNWMTGEPSNSDQIEHCLSMNTNTSLATLTNTTVGEWNDEVCSMKLPSICRYVNAFSYGSTVSSPVYHPDRLCPSGYTYHYNICLQATTPTTSGIPTPSSVPTDSGAWFYYCSRLSTGTMAYMTTLAHNRWYYEYVRSYASIDLAYYIYGVKYGGSTWVWNSNLQTPIGAYTQWDTAMSQPDNYYGNEYTMVWPSRRNGQWHDFPSIPSTAQVQALYTSIGLIDPSPLTVLSEMYTLCQVGSSSPTPTAAPTTSIPSFTPSKLPTYTPSKPPSYTPTRPSTSKSCPTGFTNIAYTDASSLSVVEGCYQVKVNVLNWFDAERYCNSIGSHLLTIQSNEERSAVYAAYSWTGVDMWIGGSDISLDGEWRWIDSVSGGDGQLFASATGSVSYGNYAYPTNEYSLTDISRNCAGMKSSGGGYWGIYDCSSLKISICEYSAPIDEILSPVSAYGKTCPSGYTYHYNTCLMASSFQSTHDGFKTYCANQGSGQLATMSNFATNRWFYEYIRSWGNIANAYFVGAQKIVNPYVYPSGTVWAWERDGSYFSYFNWDSGQPDNTWGGESCVTYNNQANGKWNDYNCDWQAYGLCQADPISYAVPTRSPTTVMPTLSLSPSFAPTVTPTISPTTICPIGSAYEYKWSSSSQSYEHVCVVCPAGKYSSTSNNYFGCNTCQSGSYSNHTGASTCTLCPQGTYSSMYGSTSSVNCLACPPGSASYIDGASQCSTCTMGKYSSSYGSTTCLSPPTGAITTGYSGTYNEGATGYAYCPSGTHPLRVVNRISTYYSAYYSYDISCGQCEAGTFYDQVGDGRYYGEPGWCVACTYGTFSSTKDANKCTKCSLVKKGYEYKMWMTSDEMCEDSLVAPWLTGSIIALVIVTVSYWYFFVGQSEQWDRLAIWRRKVMLLSVEWMRYDVIESFYWTTIVERDYETEIERARERDRTRDGEGSATSTLPSFFLFAPTAFVMKELPIWIQTPLLYIILLCVYVVRVLFVLIRRYACIILVSIIVYRNTIPYLFSLSNSIGEDDRGYKDDEEPWYSDGNGEVVIERFTLVLEAMSFSSWSQFSDNSIIDVISKTVTFTLSDYTSTTTGPSWMLSACRGILKPYLLLIMIVVLYIPFSLLLRSNYLIIQSQWFEQSKQRVWRLLYDLTMIHPSVTNDHDHYHYLPWYERCYLLILLTFDCLCFYPLLLVYAVAFAFSCIVLTPFVSYHGMASWSEECNAISSDLQYMDVIVAAFTTLLAYIFVILILYHIGQGVVSKSKLVVMNTDTSTADVARPQNPTTAERRDVEMQRMDSNEERRPENELNPETRVSTHQEVTRSSDEQQRNIHEATNTGTIAVPTNASTNTYTAVPTTASNADEEKEIQVVSYLPTLDMFCLWHWYILSFIREQLFPPTRADIARRRLAAYYDQKERTISAREWQELTEGEALSFRSFMRQTAWKEKLSLYFSLLLYNVFVFMKACIGYWDSDVMRCFEVNEVRKRWRDVETKALPPANNGANGITEDEEQALDGRHVNDASYEIVPTAPPMVEVTTSDPSAPPLPISTEDEGLEGVVVRDSSLIQHQPDELVSIPVANHNTTQPAVAERERPASPSTDAAPFTCLLDHNYVLSHIMHDQLVIHGLYLVLLPFGSLLTAMTVFTGDCPLYIVEEEAPQGQRGRFLLQDHFKPYFYSFSQAWVEAEKELMLFVGTNPLPRRPGETRENREQYLAIKPWEHKALSMVIVMEKSRMIQWMIGMIQYVFVLTIVFYFSPMSLICWILSVLLLLYAILISMRYVVYGSYWIRLAKANQRTLPPTLPVTTRTTTTPPPPPAIPSIATGPQAAIPAGTYIVTGPTNPETVLVPMTVLPPSAYSHPSSVSPTYPYQPVVSTGSFVNAQGQPVVMAMGLPTAKPVSHSSNLFNMFGNTGGGGGGDDSAIYIGGDDVQVFDDGAGGSD